MKGFLYLQGPFPEARSPSYGHFFSSLTVASSPEQKTQSRLFDAIADHQKRP